MSVISKCPKCSEPVCIPPKTVVEAVVRCPLCTAEFPLADALAAIPPTLIVVNAGPGGLAVLPSEAGEQVPSTGEDGAVATDAPPAAELPDSEIVDDLVLAEGGAAAADAAETDAATAVDTETAPTEDEPAFDATAFHGIGVSTPTEEEEGETKPKTPAKPLKRRRKPRPPKNPVVEFIKIALGGFLGLAIGYYLLNFFGGKKFDIIEVYLPGCPHTYVHWKSKADATEKPEGNGEQPAPAKKPAKPAPAATTPPDNDPSALSPPDKPAKSEKFETSDDLTSPPLVDPTKVEMPKIDVPGTGPKKKPAPTPPKKVEKAEAIGPVDPPSFTSDELGAALKAANDAFGCPKCQSQGFLMKDGKKVVCDLCKGKPKEEMTPEIYAKFCRLAEVLTYVPPSDDEKFSDRRLAAEALLRRVARAGLADDVGRLAANQLQSNSDRLSGVFLACRMGKPSAHGQLHGATIELLGIPQRCGIFAGQPFPVAANDEALILASVVRDPATNFRGAQLKQSSILWLGLAAKVTP